MNNYKKEYIGSGYKSGEYEKVYEAQKQGIDPADYFIYKDMEMSASRMAVTCRALDDDLRHRKFFRFPACSDP